MPEVEIIESIRKSLPAAATVELLWKLLPVALLVPFITFFLGRVGTNAERKLEYRTFLHVDEITAKYNLKNMPAIKSRTRLFKPYEYQGYETWLNKRAQDGTLNIDNFDLKYLKIQSFGKSIVTSGSISIKMNSQREDMVWYLNVSLPILDVNEEIYIPVERVAMLNVSYYIKEVVINYRTQSGEKMRFKSTIEKVEDSTIVKNTYSVKKFNLFFQPIDKHKGNNMQWSFLNGN